MTVKISWRSFEGAPPPKPQSVALENLGTIGRAIDNHFVIHDPNRYSSRKHARVLFERGTYWLENLSVAGTKVNGANRLQPDQKYPLQAGDVIEIGDCALVVDSINLPVDIDVDDTYSQTQNIASASGVNANVFNVDDFNFDDSPDFKEKGDISSVSSQNVSQPFTESSNIDDLFSDKPPHTPQYSAPQPNAERKIVDTYPSKRSNNADTLAIKAFLKELGIGSDELNGQDKTEVMKNAAIILKTFTKGIMGVLVAKDAVKTQFDIEKTRYQKSAVNPLKFSSSPDDALSKMLTRKEGAMDPIESANEAVNDTKAHQIAMMQGVKAVITKTVANFDPQKLEKECSVGFAPFGKGARLWEYYCEHFDKIAEDSSNNANNQFSQYFSEQYAKQLKNAKRAFPK